MNRATWRWNSAITTPGGRTIACRERARGKGRGDRAEGLRLRSSPPAGEETPGGPTRREVPSLRLAGELEPGPGLTTRGRLPLLPRLRLEGQARRILGDHPLDLVGDPARKLGVDFERDVERGVGV